MTTDQYRLGDTLEIAHDARPFMHDRAGLVGHGFWELFDESHRCLECRVGLPCTQPEPCADKIRTQDGEFSNLITQVGDQYYGERAAGIGSPPAQVTGMQLGTGTTAVAKTGAGAAVVTYVTSSAVAIDATFPQSSIPVASRRIIWKTTWVAGVATVNAIAEVVLINQAVATNSGAAAAATISRALLSPVVNKGASDSLAVTWNHDLLGA